MTEPDRTPPDGLGRFGLILATLLIGLVAVVSLSSAWLALVVGAIVVALVTLDVMLHGATHEPERDDDVTPKRLTIDRTGSRSGPAEVIINLDKRVK